jgi:hypothetical protein
MPIPRLWRRLAEFIRQHDEPVMMKQIREKFPGNYTRFNKPLRVAVIEGSDLWLGPRQGWISNPDYDPLVEIS